MGCQAADRAARTSFMLMTAMAPPLLNDRVGSATLVTRTRRRGREGKSTLQRIGVSGGWCASQCANPLDQLLTQTANGLERGSASDHR